ncbi:hypothetical protein M885DRAFT_140639 [Pelagophyceae sp. CCMP2097]|nr:hypothetical protein M885DRAFT_140639 [Pelagophyceae sp. CCMP2097]
MLWESSWDAIIGPASILLGVSFAFGSSCAQVVAGVSYVLFTAPYDIGDRVLIKEIREVDFPSPPLTIQAIGPMMTTFVTSFGETITVANHLLATKAMINHTRSPTPFLRVTVSVATRTDPEEVTKLRHALERYVLDNRGDWHVAYLFFSAMNHEKGEMVLDAWMGAANSYHDWDAVYGARSRAYVWLHQYIFKNGLHFVKPTQPFAGADAMPKKLARDDDDRQDHPRDDNAALARRLADLEARLGVRRGEPAGHAGPPLFARRGRATARRARDAAPALNATRAEAVCISTDQLDHHRPRG